MDESEVEEDLAEVEDIWSATIAEEQGMMPMIALPQHVLGQVLHTVGSWNGRFYYADS